MFPSLSSLSAILISGSLPVLLTTYVQVTVSPIWSSGPVLTSASSPLVAFSSEIAGTGLKNPKSTVILPLVSSAPSSASSVPASPPASVGSVPRLRVNVPEVWIEPALVAMFESLSVSSLSLVF